MHDLAAQALNLGFGLATAPGSNQGSFLTQIFTGIAAVIGAYSAYRLTKRDSNETDLKDTTRKLKEANDRLDDYQADMLDLRTYVYNLRSTYASHGIETAEPPTLRTQGR